MTLQEINKLEDKMPIPLLFGKIIQVNEPKKEGKENPALKQTIQIEISGGTLSVKLSEKHHVKQDNVGDTIEVYAQKKGDKYSGCAKRAMGNKTVVSVTDTATVYVKSRQTKKEESHSNEKNEKITVPEKRLRGPADPLISKIILERLYIISRINDMLGGNDPSGIKALFPKDKIAELATSIHISVERSGKDIVPNGFLDTIEGSVKENSAPSKDCKWKKIKHPSTGKPIGELEEDELMDKYLLFCYKNLGKAERSQLNEDTAKFVIGLKEEFDSRNVRIQDVFKKFIQMEIGSDVKDPIVKLMKALDYNSSSSLISYFEKEIQKNPKGLSEEFRAALKDN